MFSDQDVVDLVSGLKWRMCWFGGDGGSNRGNWLSRSLKYYMKCRWFVQVVQLVGIVSSFYSAEGKGFLSESLLFLPLCLNATLVTVILMFSGARQLELMKSFERQFVAQEPWMEEVRKKYTNKAWRIVRLYLRSYLVFSFSYTVLPVIVESILYYAFDLIDSHLLTPPACFNSLLPREAAWDLRFYVVSVLNVWCIIEYVCSKHGSMLGYVVSCIFYLTELRVLRMEIDLLKNLSEKDLQKGMHRVVIHHNQIISLNRDLKSYVGLECAFVFVFTTFNLPINLMTINTSTSFTLIIGFTVGFVLNVMTALIYCSVGQLLESESDKLIESMYDLPWYQYSPSARKDLNMMMRQTHNPLVIDFYGKCKMNLDNFMQILTSSYSYFAVLQSIMS